MAQMFSQKNFQSINTLEKNTIPPEKTIFDPREQKKVGMLTPSSNTVLEPVCSRIICGMEQKVTVHYARFTVTQISLEQASMHQFEFEPMLRAACELADADVDVIAWNGTSGGWLGLERDVRLCEAITRETGIPATTSMLSQVESMKKNGVKTLNLITPYITQLNEKIKEQYQECGFDTVEMIGLSQTCNRSFSLVSPKSIEQLCLEHFQPGSADALSIVCTNFPGVWCAEELEEKLKTTVYDTIATVMCKVLDVVGVPHTTIQGWGRIFSM